MNSNRMFRVAGIVSSATMLASTLAAAADAPKEWPNFRGPNHDGVSTEKGWLTDWPKEGLKQLWLVELGCSYGSVSVSDGKLYAMGSANSDKDEVFYCLDSETGKEVWKHPFPSMPRDSNPGPRSTPAVDGKFVYVATMNGQVCCLDTAAGQVVWNKDMKTDFNLGQPHHWFCGSPIVHGDLLLVNMGPAGVAFDKKTGNIAWNNTVPKSLSAYASPVPFMLGSKACVAFLSDMALVVVDEANGQTNSVCGWPGSHGENSPDPLVIGKDLFQSTPQKCGLVNVAAPKATIVAGNRGPAMASRCTTPVLVGDYVYGFSGNPDDPWAKPKKATTDFVCLDPKDCSVKWTQEGIMEGSLLAADGKLIILDRSGVLILAEASPAGYKELARARALPESQKDAVRGLHATYRKGACWAMPVLCNGRIYVRNNTGTLVCLDLRGK